MRLILFFLLVLLVGRCGSGLCPIGGCESTESSTPDPPASTTTFFFESGLFNGDVNQVISAEDGSGDIYVGGQFSYHRNGRAPGIVRLNSDASIDTSFDVSTGGFNDDVDGIALHSDGSIVAVGDFSSFKGTGVQGIAKIFPDGSLDTSLDSSSGFDARASRVSLTTNGTGDIYVVGFFNTYGGTGSRGIIRLNPDGSYDSDFDTNGGTDTYVSDLFLTPNGALYIGGQFVTYGGGAQPRMARLHSNGSVDTHFDLSAGGPDGRVANIILASDGTRSIYISGAFNNINGTVRSQIARMRSNGSLDTSFNFIGSSIQANGIALAEDGESVYLAWNLSAAGFYGILSRLNTQGGFDTSFSANLFAAGAADSILKTSDGLYVAGDFDGYNSLGRRDLVRVAPDGSLDTRFKSTLNSVNNTVTLISFDTQGKVYLSGTFTAYRAESTGRLTRLHENGELDTGFRSSIGITNTIALTPDEKVYAGGNFTSPTNRIVRLYSDGSIDSDFDVSAGGFNNSVNSITLMTDGSDRVYVGGNFTTYGGASANRIVRLFSNGTIDTSFNVGAGFNTVVETTVLAMDGSGDIYVGGTFSTYQGTTAHDIARLNSDGSLDTVFNSGSGLGSPLETIVLASDGSGKLYVGGGFDTYNGITANKILRIDSNGNFDSSFSTGTGFGNGIGAVLVNDVAFDSENRILVAGRISTYNGTTAMGVVRLFSDGSIDTSFDTTNGFQNESTPGGVSVLTLSTNGSLYIGGSFFAYRDTAAQYLIRLDSNGNRN